MCDQDTIHCRWGSRRTAPAFTHITGLALYKTAQVEWGTCQSCRASSWITMPLLCHRVGKALNDTEQRKKRGLCITRPIILGKHLVYMASLSIIVLGRSHHHPRLCLPPQRIPSPPLPQTMPHSRQGVINAAVLVLFFALSPVCHVSPPVVPHYTTLASVSLNKQEILPQCIGPCKESGFWSPIRLDE